MGADLKLTMVDDEGHETMWTIKQKNLLIDGSVFGDSEDSCHLAIMKSHDRDDLTKWYVGNIMFQDMVVTFDASKKDEGWSDNLYIGLAQKGRFADFDDFYHTPETLADLNNMMDIDEDEWIRAG